MLASSAEGIQLHSRGSHTDTHTHTHSHSRWSAQSAAWAPQAPWMWLILYWVTVLRLLYLTLTHTFGINTHTHAHGCQLVWSFTHLPNQGHCLFFSFLPTSSLLFLSHPSPGLMNFTTWRLPVSGREQEGGGERKERDRERIKFCWCLVNGSEVSGMASDLCCMDTLFKDHWNSTHSQKLHCTHTLKDYHAMDWQSDSAGELFETLFNPW